MLVVKLPYQTLRITGFVHVLNNLDHLFRCLVGLSCEEEILKGVADRHGEPVGIALVDVWCVVYYFPSLSCWAFWRSPDRAVSSTTTWWTRRDCIVDGEHQAETKGARFGVFVV